MALLIPLVTALFSGCSGDNRDQELLQSQKQPIDKAREAERLLQERVKADRERLDKL